MSLPSIPILRAGVPYESLDLNEILSVRGQEPVVTTHMANSGLVKRDLLQVRKARRTLAECSTDELIAMTKKAGEYFLHDDLPLGTDGGLQSPEDYLQQLAATSGLPHALIRMNMKKLSLVFEEIENIIAGLTRGVDLAILDAGHGETNGVPCSFFPLTDVLSIIMPSNSPAVNALWIPAIAFKIPVLIKPGREEPWTPWRIIQAFLKAGAPPEAFSFYPTDHEGSNAIIRRSGRVMVFGDDSTVAKWEHDPSVEVHGAGHTKILFGDDKIDDWEKYLDIMEESVAANSGRSCINTSTILVPRHGDAIAEALAKRLATVRPLPPEDEGARISGFANPKMAEWIDGAVTAGLEQGGATDVTAPFRPEVERRMEVDSMHYLLPTVVRLDSVEHELYNKEYLFPFVQIVEVPQAEMLDVIGKTLVVTAISDDREWQLDLLGCPLIDRLNLGAFPTCRVQWNQPHEGNLFDFLFKRRAIHVGDLVPA